MGSQPIIAGAFGKALPITGKAEISPLSQWPDINQTGVAGSCLNGSQIYTGIGGAIDVILADTVGAQDTVAALSFDPITSGRNYFSSFGVPTTVTSLVHKSPANQPSGLTVDITAPLVDAIDTPGTGYTTGNYIDFAGTGLVADIIVFAGTGALASVSVTDFGTAQIGDTFDPASLGGTGGLFRLVSFGGVTKAVVADAGTNYSVGDIITIVQAGTTSDATYTVASTGSLLPTAADKVSFTNLTPGTILPVAVDYVLDTPAGAATGLVALR